MINKITIDKIKDNITSFFKMVGTKESIKNTFITPFGLYTRPKNQRGLSIENDRYTIALHTNTDIPISLKDNDIVLTDGKGKSYLHIMHKEDKIKIFTNEEVEITTKDIFLNASNNKTETIGNDNKIDIGNNKTETIGNDNKIDVGNNFTINTTNSIVSNSKNVTINASSSMTINTPVLNLNLDNFNINVKEFNVNASSSIKFTSPKFTHNGVNVGDTHVHFVKQAIFGGTNSKVPH
jgi:hypothetical protein